MQLQKESVSIFRYEDTEGKLLKGLSAFERTSVAEAVGRGKKAHRRLV